MRLLHEEWRPCVGGIEMSIAAFQEWRLIFQSYGGAERAYSLGWGWTPE
jgi:hypothetical protein